MSNSLNSVGPVSPDVWLRVPESEKVQRTASQSGAIAIRLSNEVTFADIFAGRVPINSESIIYDRSGVQIDAAELLAYVDVSTEEA